MKYKLTDIYRQLKEEEQAAQVAQSTGAGEFSPVGGELRRLTAAGASPAAGVVLRNGGGAEP